MQFRLQNWNWNRIKMIFSDVGIGIGIESKTNITGRNWNLNLIGG